MHITGSPPHILRRNKLRQQLLSESESRLLRFYCYNLCCYNYTLELFQVPLLFGYRLAPHLCHATVSWNILMNTYAKFFHFWPVSPTDVPTPPVAYLISSWVKQQVHRQIISNFPQAALERCLLPLSPISLESTYQQFYAAIFFLGSSSLLC